MRHVALSTARASHLYRASGVHRVRERGLKHQESNQKQGQGQGQGQGQLYIEVWHIISFAFFKVRIITSLEDKSIRP